MAAQHQDEDHGTRLGGAPFDFRSPIDHELGVMEDGNHADNNSSASNAAAIGGSATPAKPLARPAPGPQLVPAYGAKRVRLPTLTSTTTQSTATYGIPSAADSRAALRAMLVQQGVDPKPQPLSKKRNYTYPDMAVIDKAIYRLKLKLAEIGSTREQLKLSLRDTLTEQDVIEANLHDAQGRRASKMMELGLNPFLDAEKQVAENQEQ